MAVDLGTVILAAGCPLFTEGASFTGTPFAPARVLAGA
jgi:hypothetical protein